MAHTPNPAPPKTKKQQKKNNNKKKKKKKKKIKQNKSQSKLNVKKSSGVDNISAKILKACAPSFSHAVSSLINLSFAKGTLPSRLKKTKSYLYTKRRIL